MSQWEVNEENVQRWWSECRDVGPLSTERGATYWRNVAYVLLRYVITGDDGTPGYKRQPSSLAECWLRALRSSRSSSRASSDESSSIESRRR